MLKKIGKIKKVNGMIVYFLLDDIIFSIIKFLYEILVEWLREFVFFLKGVKILFFDFWGEELVKEVFYYEEGIKEFVDYLNEEKDILILVVYFLGEKEGIEVEVVY